MDSAQQCWCWTDCHSDGCKYVVRMSSFFHLLLVAYVYSSLVRGTHAPHFPRQRTHCSPIGPETSTFAPGACARYRSLLITFLYPSQRTGSIEGCPRHCAPRKADRSYGCIRKRQILFTRYPSTPFQGWLSDRFDSCQWSACDVFSSSTGIWLC